jgi:trehalose 6-phosphate phosphatase
MILQPGLNNHQVEGFFKRLAAARSSALLLDYDGTLAPFRRDPADAVPYPAVQPLLANLTAASSSRLVIVSGRRAKDLPPLLGLDDCPEIWGSHGKERLFPDGRYELVEIAPDSQRALDRARQQAIAAGLRDWLEAKPGCLAVHFRGRNPEKVKPVENELVELWKATAEENSLSLHAFDGGYELRTRDRDKGDAVVVILREMQEDVLAAYLGDDLTDEDAFEKILEGGLPVLVRSEPRPTAARAWLRPPDELVDFLEKWIEVTCPR